MEAISSLMFYFNSLVEISSNYILKFAFGFSKKDRNFQKNRNFSETEVLKKLSGF